MRRRLMAFGSMGTLPNEGEKTMPRPIARKVAPVAVQPETAAYVNDLIAVARDVHLPIDPSCQGCVAAMIRIAHCVAHIPPEYRA